MSGIFPPRCPRKEVATQTVVWQAARPTTVGFPRREAVTTCQMVQHERRRGRDEHFIWTS